MYTISESILGESSDQKIAQSKTRNNVCINLYGVSPRRGEALGLWRY